MKPKAKVLDPYLRGWLYRSEPTSRAGTRPAPYVSGLLLHPRATCPKRSLTQQDTRGAQIADPPRPGLVVVC